jgi:ankyrin repeat protein
VDDPNTCLLGCIFLPSYRYHLHRVTPLQVQLLLENGGDVNKGTEDDGTTPLHMCAQEGHYAVVQLLLKNGADPNKKTHDDGATALHLAAQEGKLDIVELLLKGGCLNFAMSTSSFSAARRKRVLNERVFSMLLVFSISTCFLGSYTYLFSR